MISDLSFLCSTVTFADPPTLRYRCNEQERGRDVRLFFFIIITKKKKVRVNVRLAEFMHACIFIVKSRG